MENIHLKKAFVLVIVLPFLVCIGCSNEQKVEQSSKDKSGINIVCTTGMITDMVKNIGQGRVNVIGLMGPGVDPHYYKASQGDIQKLGRADIILYNGLYLEGKMQDIFKKMARKKKVVAVSKNVPVDLLRKPPEFDGNYDPHIWFDVSMWRNAIDVVVTTLTEIDIEGAESFKQNGQLYHSKLDSLHQWVQKQIAIVPQQQRVLVTAHDAFGYFGSAYGIEVIGLQGISTVAEFGVNDVSRLVKLVASRGIKAIFVESSVSQRSINAVREGCRASGFDVKIGGTLYSDAMGEVGSGADTYIGMVRANVNTIVKALK